MTDEITKAPFAEAPDTDNPKQGNYGGSKRKKKNYQKDYKPHNEEKVEKVENEEPVEDVTDNEVALVNEEVLPTPVEEETKPLIKKRGKVVLVGKATISVIEENGNIITIKGHREDVKIGDIVEY